jgi:hypothetical protein
VNRVEASVAYLYRNIPSAFSVPTLEGTIADNVLWAVFLTAALLVGLYALWRKFPVVTLYLLGTAAVLTLYPFKMTRFIVPVVPLLLLAMAAGLVMLARRVSGRGSLLATSLLCLPLIVGGVNVDLRMINQSRQCETSDPWGPTLCSTPAQRGFFAAAAFARSGLPRDAVVVTVKEATFALLTDLRVQHPERVIRQDSINLIETMQANGVGYILVTPIHHSRLSRLLLAECAQLEVVESFTDDTHILKIAAEQDHDSREACEVLRRVARDSRFTPVDQLAPE